MKSAASFHSTDLSNGQMRYWLIWTTPSSFTRVVVRFDPGEKMDCNPWLVQIGIFSVGIIRWSPPWDTVLTQVFIGEMFYKHFFRSYVLYMNDWWWFFIEIRNPNVSDKVFSWISLIYKSAIKKIIGQFY